MVLKKNRSQAPKFRIWCLAPKSVVPLLLLFFSALIPYLQVLRHDFVLYDNYEYLIGNPLIRRGVTWEGIRYAFTTFETGDWQPLTWISWMIDASLFGLNPGPYHLMNVLLHIANGLLLFAVLKRVTGAHWRSFLVSLLFLIHPLHVESVAWAAERKDTLSTLLWFLTLWVYVNRRRGGFETRPYGKPIWYFASLFCFTLGLMAKPMLVTLPVWMVLMEWFLRRTKQVGARFTAPAEGAVNGAPTFLSLLPFFFLSLASCIVTYVANHSAGGSLTFEEYSVPMRLANAVVSYVGYIQKTFWPVRLTYFYPHPKDSLSPVLVAASALLISAVTFVAIRFRRRAPYLFVGWLWYLITLIPVIGLVQVGAQAMADRYTYVPLVGIFIVIVWGGADLMKVGAPFMAPSEGAVNRAPTAIIFPLFILIALSYLTFRQISYWKNDETLNFHALAVTRDNYVAHANLGFYYELKGEKDKAARHYSESLGIHPKNPDVLSNLGRLRFNEGNLAEAEKFYQTATALNPRHVKAMANRGILYLEKKEFDKAEELFLKALEVKPDHTNSLLGLAQASYEAGNLAVHKLDWEKARQHFLNTVSADPRNSRALNNLGSVYFQLGEYQKAAESYRNALAVNPAFHEAARNLQKVLDKITRKF